MDINGKIVTWDALNPQKETVEAVICGKGDYVAALKGNHPLFYKELQEYFFIYNSWSGFYYNDYGIA